MVERIHPKARQTLDFKRKVDLQKLFIAFALTIVHDVIHHGVNRFVVQRIHIDAAHITMHPDHGRQASRQVQVGSLVFNAECQQLCDIHA